MIENLKSISMNNDNIVKNEEEVARLKNTVEIVQHDINQKKRVLLDQRAWVDDFREQLKELDEELEGRDRRIQD